MSRLPRLVHLALAGVVAVSSPGSSVAPPAKRKAAGTLYLMTVTVGTHDPNGTRDDWNYTAAELEQVVKAHSGPVFRDVKSHLIRGSDATPAGVMKGFAWLQENVQEGDLALVYVGAHGGGDAKRGFRLYANGGEVFGDEIKPALGKVKGHVVLVLQACNAGSILLKYRNDREALPGNVAAICACKAGQHSHGIMLPPVLEALHGWADADGDGVVTVNEFFRYIEYRVGTFYPAEWATTQQAAATVPGEYDRHTTLAKASPARKLGTTIVMVESKTDWYGGTLIPKKDPEKKGRHLVHFFDSKKGEEEWVGPERICPPDAEPVIVRKGEKWYAAALLRRDGGTFHVRYIGSFGNREEAVGRDRIRAYSLDGPAGGK